MRSSASNSEQRGISHLIHYCMSVCVGDWVGGLSLGTEREPEHWLD